MFTQSAKDRILTTIFNGGGNFMPSPFFVGLSLTVPTEDGSNITEPDETTGYQRMAWGEFTAPDGGMVTNQSSIIFPPFSKDAGTATHYVLFDRHGEPFWFDELVTPRDLTTDTVQGFVRQSLHIRLVDAVCQIGGDDA